MTLGSLGPPLGGVRSFRVFRLFSILVRFFFTYCFSCGWVFLILFQVLLCFFVLFFVCWGGRGRSFCLFVCFLVFVCVVFLVVVFWVFVFLGLCFCVFVEFPPLFAIPSCLTDRRQSLWKLPVDVVSKSFQDVVKVAQKLENAVQSVVGSDFHSPGMDVDHDALWLALLNEIQQPRAHAPNCLMIECDGNIEKKLSSTGSTQHVYVNEEEWAVVYRDVTDGIEVASRGAQLECPNA